MTSGCGMLLSVHSREVRYPAHQNKPGSPRGSTAGCHRGIYPLQVQSWPRRAGNSRLFSFPFFKNHTTRFLRSDLTYPAVRRNKPKSLSGQKRQPTWLTVAPVGTRGWWPSALLPHTPLLTVTHLRQMFTPCYLLSKEEKKNQVSRSSLFLTRGSILSHCSPRVPLSF